MHQRSRFTRKRSSGLLANHSGEFQETVANEREKGTNASPPIRTLGDVKHSNRATETSYFRANSNASSPSI